MDALVILGELTILPISTFALKSKLLSLLFRYRESDMAASKPQPTEISKSTFKGEDKNDLKTSKKSALFASYFNSKDVENEQMLSHLRRDFR